MRQKRAKAYRKLMHLYCQSFGFRQPYQVLLDSETCRVCISLKIDIVKQLGTILQGEVKPMITQCCIHELYLQGKPQQDATNLAKTFERRKCNHKEPIPGEECLLNVIGDRNKHRYVVTTQSQSLRIKLRTIPATPIVHINRSVVVLEPPSDITLQNKGAAEEQLLHATALDEKHVSASTPVTPKPNKKRGAKGPNPLSVKKKKVGSNLQIQKPQGEDGVVGTGAKRKREDHGDDATADVEVRKRKRKRKHKNPSLLVKDSIDV